MMSKELRFMNWLSGFIDAVGPNRTPTQEQWDTMKQVLRELKLDTTEYTAPPPYPIPRGTGDPNPYGPPWEVTCTCACGDPFCNNVDGITGSRPSQILTD